MLYFAYGSNMDVQQMAARCPGAIRKKPAVLHDYKLTERLYADIDECAGKAVSGLLWSISEKDLESLDKYEGFPTFYTRKTVNVWVETSTGSRMQPALVYIMTPEAKKRRDGKPYKEFYRNLCSRAARAAGIPDEFMAEAKA